MFVPQKTSKQTRTKQYNTVALPALLYGSQNWTIKARETRITAAEMKYMRKTAGYIWTDYKPDSKRTQYNRILDNMEKYGRNLLQHSNRMAHSRLPRILQNYRQRGRSNEGRPLKRQTCEPGTGEQVAQLRVNLSTTMMMVMMIMMMMMN